MKKQFLVLVSISLLFVFANTESFAQNRLGGALAYANDFDLGIQFNTEFFFAENIAFAPDFSLYFPSGFTGWIININGHYYFMEPNSGVYGLAGLQIANASQTGFSSTELGLNLGGGYGFDLGGNITPFGQLMLVIGDFNDVIISGGARFNIGG